MVLRAGVPTRIRFIAIMAVTGRRLRLLDDTTVVSWQVVAKDGRELPRGQQVTGPAAARFGAGETMDVIFTPTHTGRYTLEVTSLFDLPRITRLEIDAVR